ncbi:MAG: hypothetical protein ABUK20_03990 [Anaerolineales bacterium]
MGVTARNEAVSRQMGEKAALPDSRGDCPLPKGRGHASPRKGVSPQEPRTGIRDRWGYAPRKTRGRLGTGNDMYGVTARNEAVSRQMRRKLRFLIV